MDSKGSIAITYAWGYESTGDMAIAPGLLRLIREALPGVTPSIHTYATDPDSHNRTARYLHRFEPDLVVHPDPFAALLGRGTPEQLQWRFYSLLLDSDRALEESRRLHPGAIDSWLSADLRLFNSSMQLTHRADCRGLRYWLPNALSRQLKRPYALWSQSFGEIAFPGREMLNLFLSDSELFTNRDLYSLEVLSKLPLHGPITGYTADPVVFFDHRDPDWAGQFLRAQGLRPGQFLIVLPRTFDFWGAEPRPEVLSDRIDTLVRTIEEWIARTGQNVLIGYELPREKERSQQLLWPRLRASAREKCRLFSGSWTAEQALATFSQASVVLSMERYSVYLALNAGVPVLHPTTNEISLRMDVLDRMGLSESHVMIDERSHEDLVGKLLTLRESRETHLRKAAIGVASSRAESIQTMQSLWRRLETRPASAPHILDRTLV